MLLKKVSGTINYSWYLSETTGEVVFYAGGAATASNTAPTLNAWNHVAIVVDGSGATFYLNGVADGTSLATVGSANSGDVFLGSDSGSSFFFAGKIDDVRIYNVAKNASAVSALYAGTDDQTGIVGHWKLDDGAQGAPVDGDTILELTSKEGSRYQFQQATNAKRPTYLGSAINSKAGLVFDGTDDLLRLASAPLTGTAGYLWIAG